MWQPHSRKRLNLMRYAIILAGGSGAQRLEKDSALWRKRSRAAREFADHVPLFYGKAVVVIRAEEGKGGAIDVTATSGGLREARGSLK